MACQSIQLSDIARSCLGQTSGGIKRCWVVNHDSVSFGDDDVVLASGTTLPQKIVDINLTSGTTFNKWELNEQTASYASNSTIDTTTNSVQYQNTLSLTFFGLNEDTRLQMLAATFNPMSVVFEDSLGQLWYMGYFSYCRATNNSSEIGASLTDRNAYTLEITENSMYDSIPLVLTAERRTALGLV